MRRFWSKVKRGPGCWEWQAASRNGYGMFSVGGRKGGMVSAHRHVWEMSHTTIPEGKVICHTCDNRVCVRPSDLFIGTQQDNLQDASNKGRLKGNKTIKGERNPKSKLTEEQVRSIRDDDRQLRVIASDYGVTYGLIGMIKRRKIWKHIQ